jgi:hypothetical protein
MDASAATRSADRRDREREYLAGLLARLDGAARGCLTDFSCTGPSLYACPFSPPDLADFEHLARSVLRLYDWPAPTDDQPYPGWVAVRASDGAWRPVGPDWDPRPGVEQLDCRRRPWPPMSSPGPPLPEAEQRLRDAQWRRDVEQGDPELPPVDARQPALELLFFIAELRRAVAAGDPVRAGCAGFQVAECRAHLVTLLGRGRVIAAGRATMEGGREGASNRTDATLWTRIRELDGLCKARGVSSERARAREIAERTHEKATTVRDILRKISGKVPRRRPRRRKSS